MFSSYIKTNQRRSRFVFQVPMVGPVGTCAWIYHFMFTTCMPKIRALASGLLWLYHLEPSTLYQTGIKDSFPGNQELVSPIIK